MHISSGEFPMAPLTLQEVIERINKTYPLAKRPPAGNDRTVDQPHRPEFYVPRIARRLANFKFAVFHQG